MSQQLVFMGYQETREERLEKEVKKLRDQCENVRKGLWAKQARADKLIDQLEREMEFLKSSICKEQKRSIF